MTPTVDALLFDFGGVLVNVHFERTFAAWAAATGESADELMGRFRFDAQLAAYERGEVDAPAYFEHVRRVLDVNVPTDVLLEGWMAMIGEPLDGIADLIASVSSRLPLYVFSNTNAEHYADWGPRFADLLKPFSAIFCSQELGVRKPDAVAFERVAREMNVPLQRIAFFDDFAPNVTGARATGLQAFQVKGTADVLRHLGAVGIRIPEE